MTLHMKQEKHSVLWICLLAFSILMFSFSCRTSAATGIDYPALYAAIAAVEGDTGKVGPAGDVGPLQITDICRRDLARLGLNLTREDCRDPVKCMAALVKYTTHYGANGVADAARLWNAGPRRQGAERYADRVVRLYTRATQDSKK